MTKPNLDYHGIFDASPNPYLVLDRNLNIVTANRAYLALTKRDIAEIVGRWAWDAFPTDPETLKQSIASFERVIHTRQPDTIALLRFDIPCPEEEGGGYTTCYWSLTHTPVLNAAGEVDLVVQHALDVTELERLRQPENAVPEREKPALLAAQTGLLDRAQTSYRTNLTLRATIDRLESMFQQAPGFMAVLRDPEHVYELANDAYLQLVGRRDIIGKPIREALPELEEQGFFYLLDQVYATAKPFTGHRMSAKLQRHAGLALDERFVDFVFQPIFGTDDKVEGIFIQGNDVTEQKHIEDELRENEGRLRALINTTADVVYRMSPDWRQMRELEGRGLLKDTANPCDFWLDHYIPPEDQNLVRNTITQAICSKTAFELEHRVRRADGTIGWTLSRAVPMLDADGQIYEWIGAASDITDRKRAEEDLKEAGRRKDEFLAMLAHELRNPLAPISSAAQLLQMPNLDEARVRRTSEVIVRQVRHMTSLVDDLLDVSRVTRGMVELEKVPLDVRRIVADAVEQVSPLIQTRRHHLMLHVPPEMAVVSGDKKRLVQVLSNLLANAAKYTPEGGNIVLQSELLPDQVILSVQDDGIGMAPGLVERVFELFTQAERTSDRSGGGLGLGLALVKSLVHLHDGKVACTSPGLGKGSRFTVCLPRLVNQDQRVDRRQGPRYSLTTSRPLKIMVVDDNADAAQMLAMFLETPGHQVIVEYHPRRALERARVELPDVYLLDIGLPEMDGNEMARHLRAQPETAGAILIAVTGYGQEDDRQKSAAAGFDHHLTKPVDIARLSTILAAFSRSESMQRI